MEQACGIGLHADFPTSSTPGRLLWRRFLICTVSEKIRAASQLRRATGVRRTLGERREIMFGPSTSAKDFPATDGRARACECQSTPGRDCCWRLVSCAGFGSGEATRSRRLRVPSQMRKCKRRLRHPGKRHLRQSRLPSFRLQRYGLKAESRPDKLLLRLRARQHLRLRTTFRSSTRPRTRRCSADARES